MTWYELIEIARGPLVSAILKTTLVFGVTALLLTLTRERSASLRYVLVTAGLVLGATLPLLGPLVPASAATTLTLPAEPTAGQHVLPAASLISASDSGLAPTSETEALQPRFVLGALWLLGAALLLGVRARDLLRIRELTRAAQPSDRIAALARTIAAELGVPAVEVGVRDDVSVPFTWGFRRARVLLPSAACLWSEARLRAILVHELVHARRGDYWVHWAVELVRAVYWFHPLVWWLARRSIIECELACDEAVVRAGVRPESYAGTLLEVARAARRSVAVTDRGGLAVARPYGLADRVRRILEPLPSRSRDPRATFLLTGMLALVTLGAAPWTAVRRTAADELDVRARQRALWALGEREDRGAVEELLRSLDDEAPDVRAVAAWSLGEIKDPVALPALYARLDDADPLVREMVVRAIGEHERVSSLGRLTEVLSDPDPRLRAAAVWSLGEIPCRRSVELALPALADESAAVRVQALETLARFALPAVPDAAWDASNDADAGVRAAACRLYGALGDPQAIDVLLRALRDPDAGVRSAATWALDEVNPSRT